MCDDDDDDYDDSDDINEDVISDHDNMYVLGVSHTGVEGVAAIWRVTCVRDVVV